ncbi:MAG: type II secretion system minor pseudopilin GspJ [Xanthomonadales bacterium]|nr:type II secretion system minor pseudopilin GspJ [Xanthomonadales bacterium]
MSTIANKLKFSRHSTNGGFTLLELLVALSIFSLIVTAGYTGLNSLNRALQLQREASSQLADIQWAVSRMERDLIQVVNRSLRTENTLLPAFSGDSRQLRLVTLSGNSLLQQPLSEERPIHWQWQQPLLSRRAWSLPDRLSSNPPMAHSRLLENVELVDFRYRDDKGNWRSQWNSTQQGRRLPDAVQLRLQIRGFGEIRRVVELPGRRT